MGFLDELRKITQPYDDSDEFEAEAPVSREPEPERAQRSPAANTDRNRKNPFSSSVPEFDSPRPASQTARREGNVLNINTTAQLQVVLVKPERFEQAAEIADHLREKRTVVMNLEQTHKDVARRLIDFLSGVAYAQEGKIKKVAVSTYIITPYNVDIIGDLIDELENNGLYF